MTDNEIDRIAVLAHAFNELVNMPPQAVQAAEAGGIQVGKTATLILQAMDAMLAPAPRAFSDIRDTVYGTQKS